MNRADGASRRRSRQPSTSSNTFQNIHNNNNDKSVTPLLMMAMSPGPYLPAPSLRHLVGRSINLHPEDEPDHILAITFAILERAGNRAMSVKELGEAAYVQGYLRTSPSAAGQAIGTHIRNHTARHAQEPTNALLSSYRLVGGLEDARLASALYCSMPGTCRKGTTVWYLSKAAGKPCPFENTCTTPSPGNLASSASGLGVKRKIPPDDSAELQRPNKIRITLRLPPRTPIAPRPRPIIPLRTTTYDDQSCSDNTDSSDSESDDDDDQDSNSGSDDDENMLDDFNSLLAEDLPIAIPCGPTAAHRHRSGPSLAALFCHAQSQPFFDTCEPPPDSEDEDDDFHNSMLRPEMEDELNLKSEDLGGEDGDDLGDYDIKEEDLAAIVLHELASASADELPSAGMMTACPELEWTALKIEDGVFSPMEILGGSGSADSPAASLDMDDSVSSSARGTLPPSSAPPPTPWIKAEDENFMFERRYSEDPTDLASPISAIPIVSRPWEHDGWTAVPRPESVSTDDVDVDFFPDASIDAGRIQASTSAPILVPGKPKPLRLSIGGPSSSISASRNAHARRHSHAAGISNRRLSLISNAATAFSDWTSGTPEDPDAPLVTPSHTGWRTYQWPLVPAANASSSTLAHERIEEQEGGEESVAAVEETQAELESSVERQNLKDAEEELERVLTAGSLNQVLTKSLPPGQRISTLLILGIPVFQCHLESPSMVLVRRIDTDYVNISSIITYAKYLALATPAGASRSRSSTNPSTAKPSLPPPPTADELPPHHVFLTSGARELHGGWVPLSTARALVKNYHDLPPFIRRVFLSDTLADKFPAPITHVRKLLVECRAKADYPPFGKPFGNPDTLSARDLLAGGNASGSGSGGSGNNAVSTTVITDAKGPSAARGIPLSLKMTASNPNANVNTEAVPPHSYPLSPVAALSSANAQRAKAAAVNSMQSLMTLTNPNPLSSFSGWNIGVGFGKAVMEREEAPLQPEEEEMLNAMLKTPPKASVRPTPPTAPRAPSSPFSSDDEGMSVDEKEEEEAVREAVDVRSDDEEEEEFTKNTPASKHVAPRRSLRRMRSISSISSDLTVSESESSAPPPSLDSRPALKGKSINRPARSSPAIAALTTVNGNGPSTRTRRAPAAAAAAASIALPARSEPETAKRVKIIEMDEPSDLVKPRRSIRTAKSDPLDATPTAAAPAPAPTPAPRQGKATKAAPVPEVKAAPVAKSRRSTATEKEVEKDGPVLTRAGAAAAQKNAKRTLRSRA